MNGSLVENQFLNDTNTNSSTTLDGTNTQTTLITTTTVIQNQADKNIDPEQLNDDNKDDLAVNIDNEQQVRNN